MLAAAMRSRCRSPCSARSLGEGLDFSTTVVDLDGGLLRPYATPVPLAAAGAGRWRRSLCLALASD
jgi:hypothetical protein